MICTSRKQKKISQKVFQLVIVNMFYEGCYIGKFLMMTRNHLENSAADDTQAPVTAMKLYLGRVPTWHGQFLFHRVKGHECSEGGQSATQTLVILQ